MGQGVKSLLPRRGAQGGRSGAEQVSDGARDSWKTFCAVDPKTFCPTPNHLWAHFSGPLPGASNCRSCGVFFEGVQGRPRPSSSSNSTLSQDQMSTKSFVHKFGVPIPCWKQCQLQGLLLTSFTFSACSAIGRVLLNLGFGEPRFCTPDTRGFRHFRGFRDFRYSSNRSPCLWKSELSSSFSWFPSFSWKEPDCKT